MKVLVLSILFFAFSANAMGEKKLPNLTVDEVTTVTHTVFNCNLTKVVSNQVTKGEFVPAAPIAITTGYNKQGATQNFVVPLPVNDVSGRPLGWNYFIVDQNTQGVISDKTFTIADDLGYGRMTFAVDLKSGQGGYDLKADFGGFPVDDRKHVRTTVTLQNCHKVQ